MRHWQQTKGQGKHAVGLRLGCVTILSVSLSKATADILSLDKRQWQCVSQLYRSYYFPCQVCGHACIRVCVCVCTHTLRKRNTFFVISVSPQGTVNSVKKKTRTSLSNVFKVKVMEMSTDIITKSRMQVGVKSRKRIWNHPPTHTGAHKACSHSPWFTARAAGKHMPQSHRVRKPLHNSTARSTYTCDPTLHVHSKQRPRVRTYRPRKGNMWGGQTLWIGIDRYLIFNAQSTMTVNQGDMNREPLGGLVQSLCNSSPVSRRNHAKLYTYSGLPQA